MDKNIATCCKQCVIMQVYATGKVIKRNSHVTVDARKLPASKFANRSLLKRALKSMIVSFAFFAVLHAKKTHTLQSSHCSLDENYIPWSNDAPKGV